MQVLILKGLLEGAPERNADFASLPQNKKSGEYAAKNAKIAFPNTNIARECHKNQGKIPALMGKNRKLLIIMA
jgi:hypothetical protein